MLQKIPIISKNASNKNYCKLNFLQITHWMHIFISPRRGAGGSKDSYFRNIIMYWYMKIDSHKGWTRQKITDYIKKFFKQKLLRIKFPTKNSMDAFIFISPRSRAPESSKNLPLNLINSQQLKKVFFRIDRNLKFP